MDYFSDLHSVRSLPPVISVKKSNEEVCLLVVRFMNVIKCISDAVNELTASLRVSEDACRFWI